MQAIPITIGRKAMFIPHDGFARSGKIDRFAEYLSQGMSVRDAAYRAGYRQEQGNAMLQRIRKRLGPQAC